MAAFGDAFGGARVLVTGDTGFKGAWLCAWLLELKADVTGFALPPEGDNSLFTALDLETRIHHVDGDLRDLEPLQRLIDDVRPDIVFHLAAQSLVLRGYLDPKRTFDTNIGGSVNVLEAVRGCDAVRALVYVTSDKCYRNREWMWGYRENDALGGADPYSASKAAAEIVFEAYVQSFLAARDDFGAASVRAGNVIGGGDWADDRIVPDCIRAISSNRPLSLRNPDSVRPWQHVLEPLAGYLNVAAALLEDPAAITGAWNFGPEASDMRTVRALAERVVSAWGSGSIEIEPDTGAPHETSVLYLNSDKARNVLGWQPRWTFERAVDETVRWYRDVGSGGRAADISREQLSSYMETQP